MKGSYINIWIQKGAKSKKEPETVVPNGGFENPAFNKSGSECNELMSLGFAPIEDRVDDLLHRFGIEFVVKTESNFKSRDSSSTIDSIPAHLKKGKFVKMITG